MTKPLQLLGFVVKEKSIPDPRQVIPYLRICDGHSKDDDQPPTGEGASNHSELQVGLTTNLPASDLSRG